MIIWIASYPKSGNTWLRVFISSILYSNDGIVNLENLKNIDQYPLISHFDGLIDDPRNINVKNQNDIKKIFSNLILSQDKINLDNKIKFLKTHFICANILGYNFTNYDNTLGVIHIVRDPRNVVTSIKNHWGHKNIDESCDFILNERQWLTYNIKNKDIKKNLLPDNSFPTLISSWKNHYNYWNKIKKNYLLIRYENLIKKPEEEFNKIVIYLENILNTKIDKKKIKNAIETSSFENLQSLEDQNKFDEGKTSKHGSKIRFFNLGKKNNWEKILQENVKSKIEKKFIFEMKKLGYLK